MTNIIVRLRRKIRRLADRTNKTDLVQFGLRAKILPRHVRVIQLHQQERAARENDVVVLSVVRNGAPWIRDFLNHHRDLGVHHFVILENGSTDDTLEMLAGQTDVTVLTTDVPYHAYENTMKRYLVDTFARGCWCLFVDVDELFDWPLRRGRKLSELIEYLNQRGSNAVICQMLDMWSPGGFDHAEEFESAQAAARYYSLSTIAKTPYPFWATNKGENPLIQMHWGGVRKWLFGSNNGLTKVSLFKAEPHLSAFCSWHHVQNATIADFTCVLYHYPFSRGFRDKVAEAVESGRYGYLTTDEYEAYSRGLQRGGELRFEVPDRRALACTDELVANDFLIVPEAYLERFG